MFKHLNIFTVHIYYVFLRCVYSNMTFQIFIEESGAVM